MNGDRTGGWLGGFRRVGPRAAEPEKAVNQEESETHRRRWLVLVLAGVAGFMGSGVALTPARIVTVLLSLFVAVFLVALALSLLLEPVSAEPGLLAESEPKPRKSYAGEVPQVQHEAAFGSP